MSRTDTQVAVQAVDDGLVTGAQFILDAPEHVPAVWGAGEDVLWSQGEPCYLVGPAGVGKTTLAQQLALARAGILASLEVLGYPVIPDPDRYVLYVAADRPAQAARSFRRMVKPEHRPLLEKSLLIWRGPLPLDLVGEPAEFAAWLKARGVGTVVIDSLKDVAMPLTEDAVGSGVNRALQWVVSEGVDILVLHHQRKASGDNRKPTKLADVYGSTWLVNGAGSVVLLWGEPGDLVVELSHLKQPSAEVGPLTVTHDHAAGRSDAASRLNARTIVERATSGGVTVRDAAQAMFAITEPSPNQIEKARRRLDDLVKRDDAVKIPGAHGEPSVYRPVTHRDPRVTPLASASRGVTNPDNHGSRDGHEPSREGHTARHPLKGGEAVTVTPGEAELIEAAMEQLDATEEAVA